VDVLLGRSEPPIEHGILTMMEYANAVYSRGQEIAMLIHAMEREGTVSKGSDLYRFRTGELRDFLDMARHAADLGSRRITASRMEWEQTRPFPGM
jgi:hypothetical protein